MDWLYPLQDLLTKQDELDKTSTLTNLELMSDLHKWKCCCNVEIRQKTNESQHFHEHYNKMFSSLLTNNSFTTH